MGIPAYGRRVRARLGAEKPGKRRMRPLRGRPRRASKMWRTAVQPQARPCRRKLPRHQRTFRQAGQRAKTATPPGIPAHPAPLPSGCRASGIPASVLSAARVPAQTQAATPHEAAASCGRRRPAFRGRFEERAGLLPPAGREAFFLAPFRARARKEPRRGVDGPPALFEKGMLIDAQEHRDVLVPHSLRHTFDVRPVHKRQRGEGVPQVIRA